MESIVSSILSLLIVTTIVIPNVQSYDDHCVKQYFNQNSFVCVCNETACGSIEAASLVPDGYITQWESSIDKYRLYRTDRSTKDLPINPFATLGSNVIRVILRPNDRRQKILGFGAAITDAAGFVLSSLPINLRDHIMLDYFSQMGIEYSILRVPIGGTDFSKRIYTYDDHHPDDFDLQYFKLQPEDTQLKIPILKRARELKVGPLRLLGSSWSPPGWMKTNNNITGSGFLKGSPGGPYYKAYAKYHVKFLDAYRANGINFWGITPNNEPTSAIRDPDFFYNCLGMTPEMQRDYIKLDLGPTLRESGYGKDKLDLLIHDEIRQYLINYTDTILSDPDAASFVSGISFHWYKNGEKDYYESLDIINKKFSKFYLLATEAAEGFERFSTKRAQLGNWTRAETYAQDILEDLNRGTTGWMDWNLVLNTGGGPSWAENWTDGLILVDADKKTYYRNPMFYSLGHFSKFIKPGSVYIGHNVYGNTKGVYLATFIDPSDQLIIVILNKNDYPVDVIIEKFAEGPVPLRMGPHSIRTMITPKN